MAWTAPRTWVATEVLTAAQLNEQLRDNLLETMPAKAIDQGSLFFTTAVNELTYRTPKTARVKINESTSSTSYTDITTSGPAVTVKTGANAMVFIACEMQNTTTNASAFMSWGVTGATTRSATDDQSISIEGVAASKACQLGTFHLEEDLTPGENTFTCKYKVGTGTGLFFNRFIAVLPM